MKYQKKFRLNKDEYEIISHAPVGKGSYGEIWEAKRFSDGLNVAIKVVRKEDDGEMPCSLDFVNKARDDLENEINLLSSLHDARQNHILPILDHGMVNNEPAMVLPLADKKNCQKYLKNFIKIIKQLDQQSILMNLKELKNTLLFLNHFIIKMNY